MRLIHTSKLGFEEFEGEPETFPEHAILSHCWSGEEVTYSMFNDKANLNFPG